MPQNVVKIKSRIKSVTGAYKVTSAMKLVSTVKLKQWRNKMLANKEYTNQLNEVVDLLLTFSKNTKSPYLQINKNTTKKLYIIISSTLGLCGSYNNNIFKVSDSKITNEDEAIILGGKGIAHYSKGEFKIIEGFNESYSIQNTTLIRKMSDYLLDKYVKSLSINSKVSSISN